MIETLGDDATFPGFGTVHEEAEIRLAAKEEWVAIRPWRFNRRILALGDDALESIYVQLSEKRLVVILLRKVVLHDEFFKFFRFVDNEQTIRVGHPGDDPVKV